MGQINKVKTAVIGCGMISTIYLKNMTNMFEILDVVAICDRHEEKIRRQAEAFHIEKVMTIDEICESDEIELVVNLTGPAAHYDVIKKLLLAGKNVYTEKLLCFDLEQGKELVEIANQKNLYLGVAPDTFLGAGLQTARNVIDSGFIGKVTSCSIAINRNQPLNSELFGFVKYQGGSFPYDVGVYYLTALLSLFGPVKKVTGFAAEAETHHGRMLWANTYGESWDLYGSNLQTGALLFENGIQATVHFDGISIDDEQPRVVIYGTEGILYLGDPNSFCGEVVLHRSGQENVKMPFTHGFQGTPLYGEPTNCDWGGHRGVGVAELAWSMRKHRPNRASKEMGLHTLEVLIGLDESSKTDRIYKMTTSFELPKPLQSGFMETELNGSMRVGSEYSLTI